MAKKTAKSKKVATPAPEFSSTGAGRFVLVSDLHAHVWSAFSKGDGADNTRLRHSLRVLRASLQKAQDLEVPWVFAGDIVHTAGFTVNVVLSEIVEVMIAFPDVVKLIVWGNHDARGVGGRITLRQTVLASLRRAVPQLVVLDPSVDAAPYAVGGLTFSGAGYQPRPDLLQYAAASDVGIYHQTVRGTKAPNGFVLQEGIAAEELLKRHRFVAVGHVHHWQYIEAPKGQMLLIPGSPEHHNFGDMGEHGWWVVDIKKDIEVQFSAGGSPEFRTVSSPSQVQSDGHYYRVDSVAAGEVMPDGAVAIAPTPTAIESRDVLKGARGHQILSVWLRSEPPDTKLPVERYLEVGAELLTLHETGNLRPIKLRQMKMRNFCSYADQELTIRPGTWLVMGRGRDFPSNGAGKSTLFEALFWCLFGRTTKGLSGDEVIRWGADDCEVSLRLAYDDGDWIQVTRTRGKHARCVVETAAGPMEGKSSTEVTEKLGKALGLTPELYQALGYFSQEKLLLFASATDGERKDMLADLIGLAGYQEASSVAQRNCADLEVVSQKASALKDAAERRRKDEAERLEEVQRQTTHWEAERAGRAARAVVNLEQFNAAESQHRVTMMETAMAQISTSLQEREAAARQDLNVMLQQLANPPAYTATEAELLAAQTEHAQAVSTVKSTRATIQELERQRGVLLHRMEEQRTLLASGVCPSCRQPVTQEHQTQCLKPLVDDLMAVDVRIEELQREQQVPLQVAVQLQAGLLQLQEGVKAARAVAHWEQEKARAEQQLAALAAERAQTEATAAYHVDKSLRDHRAELERVIEAIKRERNPYAVEQEGTARRVAEAEADVAVHGEARLRALESIAIYDYWRRGFSKQGIQSLLVDEVAGLFNQVRGSIFPALTQGVYDVQFSTLSQTKQGEWREKTEFQVYERGQLVPYAALSGGQRRRVDVGVMLTLVKAVSTWMQVPGVLGVLVLDEVFGFLDASGSEGLMEALREVQAQIPAIFVVSHEPHLQALFPDVIVVEQDHAGVSRIVTEAE